MFCITPAGCASNGHHSLALDVSHWCNVPQITQHDVAATFQPWGRGWAVGRGAEEVYSQCQKSNETSAPNCFGRARQLPYLQLCQEDALRASDTVHSTIDIVANLTLLL